MALQSSGAISLNQIHVEAGGSSGSQASLNDSDIRDLIGKGSGAQMSFSEWYGASAATNLTSGGTVNGQQQRQEITASSFISSGGTLVIPSNLWVWSDDSTVAALTIDISCTVDNYGKIIGHGGNGTNGSGSAAILAQQVGGPAIKINSGVSGVTVINRSGAYIAGGGGGPQNNDGKGGGGAGGGNGAYWQYGGGNGGALNSKGADGYDYWGAGYGGHGLGGGAGGSGGGADFTNQYYYSQSGGGGRILPGTGGAAVGSYGGAGGSAGNAGGNSGTAAGGSQPAGAGGGGWGAYGGGINSGARSGSGGGNPGGKAVDDSGVSYTLSNSGTIYGGT